MIARALPDIANYGSQQPELTDNAVIFSHTTEKYFYPAHKTPYLFLTNMVNSGNYVLNAKRIEISQRNFYFLNADDTLEINFDLVPLKTLFIFFSRKFIKECFSHSVCSGETHLASPDKKFDGDIEIPNVPFELTDSIKARISKLLQGISDREESDVLLFQFLTDFLGLHQETQKRITKINASKKSTKEELYRRLFKATELMRDMVFENLTLDQLAREVCLSKFHFLSSFKDLYGITPHQYHKKAKLEKAYDLLLQNGLSVTEVSYSIGFESVGSFSNSFKRQFNISPSLLLRKRGNPNFE